MAYHQCEFFRGFLNDGSERKLNHNDYTCKASLRCGSSRVLSADGYEKRRKDNNSSEMAFHLYESACVMSGYA